MDKMIRRLLTNVTIAGTNFPHARLSSAVILCTTSIEASSHENSHPTPPPPPPPETLSPVFFCIDVSFFSDGFIRSMCLVSPTGHIAPLGSLYATTSQLDDVVFAPQGWTEGNRAQDFLFQSLTPFR